MCPPGQSLRDSQKDDETDSDIVSLDDELVSEWARVLGGGFGV